MFLDVLGKNIVNLAMSRNRLLLPCCRIEVDIVTAAMPMKYASQFNELANQLAALHKAISFFL